jgi:hypothetical protein
MQEKLLWNKTYVLSRVNYLLLRYGMRQEFEKNFKDIFNLLSRAGFFKINVTDNYFDLEKSFLISESISIYASSLIFPINFYLPGSQK